MHWELLDRGFLPTPDPLPSLAEPGVSAAEELGAGLPDLVAGRRFREAAREALAAKKAK